MLQVLTRPFHHTAWSLVRCLILPLSGSVAFCGGLPRFLPLTLVVTSGIAACSSPPVRILTWLRVTLRVGVPGIALTALHLFAFPTWAGPSPAHAGDAGVDCAAAPDETLDWDNPRESVRSASPH